MAGYTDQNVWPYESLACQPYSKSLALTCKMMVAQSLQHDQSMSVHTIGYHRAILNLKGLSNILKNIMPYLIKQLKKAEECLTREEARKILKKVGRLDDKPYVKPKHCKKYLAE